MPTSVRIGAPRVEPQLRFPLRKKASSVEFLTGVAGLEPARRDLSTHVGSQKVSHLTPPPGGLLADKMGYNSGHEG